MHIDPSSLPSTTPHSQYGPNLHCGTGVYSPNGGDIQDPLARQTYASPFGQGGFPSLFGGQGGGNQMMTMIMQMISSIMTMMSQMFGGSHGVPNSGQAPTGTGEPTGPASPKGSGGPLATGGFSREPQTVRYTDQQARITGEKLITNLMKDLNITREQAAGIVGNIQAESELNPGINQGGKIGMPGAGPGFGWVQWSGPRRDQYVQFCQQQGLDPRSEAANYAFLVQELKGPYSGVLNQVRNANSAAEATTIIFRDYEGPGDNSLGRRIAFANQWL